MLIYPGHPEFQQWLSIPPPNYQKHSQIDPVALVADCETGILRPATEQEFWDYVRGGEYDERLETIENDNFT